MPINENEFVKSDRASSIVLLEFLSLNHRNAYSLDELAEVMKAGNKDLSKKDLERLLSALEYGGRVKSRTVDDKTYYKYSVVRGQKLV
jgi:predicted AAA+ superfamily ATPase